MRWRAISMDLGSRDPLRLVNGDALVKKTRGHYLSPRRDGVVDLRWLTMVCVLCQSLGRKEKCNSGRSGADAISALFLY